MTLPRAVVLGVLLTAIGSPAQAQESPLDRYVRMGLEANRGLAQQEILARQAEARWSESRASYRPSLQVDARYSRAEGGRAFDIPVGDLVNPAYDALDGLLGTDQFPTIPNQRISFLRPSEQDTRLRVTQLIWSGAARADTRSKRFQADAAIAGTEANRAALVRDIRVGYYRYANASRAVDIFDTALELVEENERTSTALWQASMVTRDHVHRARAERLEVETNRARAETNRELAASYLNYLIGREPGAEIELSAESLVLPTSGRLGQLRQAASGISGDAWIQALADRAVSQRHELDQLDNAVAAADAGLSAARATLRPSVALAVDAGLQGEEYGLGTDYRYAMASLMLSWSITSGGAGRARVRQASLERERLQTQREDAAALIRLELESAAYHARVALANLAPTRERVQEAEGAFLLVRRRQEEGLATALEFLDARATLTRSQLSQSIIETEALIRLAELDYAVGGVDTSALSATDNDGENDR